MRKLILLFFVCSAATLIGCGGASTSAPPTPTAGATTNAALASRVNAEGTIVPAQRATLASKIGGQIVEIPVREGDVVKAGATLVRLDDAALSAQVAQAQAGLSVAQKQLDQLRAGGTAAQRQAAQDALDSARATLAKVKAGPTMDELADLKANMDSAKAALVQAQSKYDRIGGSSNPFGAQAPEALALQQASSAYEAAAAALRDAASHPTESDLRAAESAVTQAESALAQLDPSAEALALAQAQVDQAAAALEVAKAAEKDTLIVAPFDGTVASVNVDAGQVIGAGTAVISFGDLSKLQVETTDLVEMDIAKVVIGQPAQVKVDAFPDDAIEGRVLRIASVANDHSGDKVYKVTIELPGNSEAGLRWGMTANVGIQTAQ
ncbi:MAG: efflux RND transporter periplasmic adaptor subunit [Chloroflexi bacterium]|nr:efflux RND transporter periplasmic adaptor subunit [Chloroflexota bacterium]